jgi:uncharacterized membrane protein YGL010W
MAQRKTVEQWFREYGESHQHRINKAIHWICVPLIAACVIAWCWEIPTPAVMRRVPYLNWATLLLAASMLFYLRLSIPLALGMLLFWGTVITGIVTYQQLGLMPLWQLGLWVFGLAWIGQFVGHTIEGKKPSFFQDLQFLLIGPIWLLGAVYRKLGVPY